MKKTKTIIMVIAIILVIALIGYLIFGYYQKVFKKVQNPIVTMEIENYGTIKIELYPEKAPNTVTNFIKLANNGFYNGLTFHRTIPDFMIQGGDKSGDGTGAPALSDINSEWSAEEKYAIEGEFYANGYTDNNLRFEEGTIAMARSDYSQLSSTLAKAGYNSAGSQFFITTVDYPSINGLYAPFGKVIEGMDVVKAIGNTEVTYRSSELAEGQEAPKGEDGNALTADMPKNPPVITNVSVETYGEDYGMPKTVEPFDYQQWLQSYYGITQ